MADRPSVNDVKSKSNSELVHELITDTSYAHMYRQEALARIVAKRLNLSRLDAAPAAKIAQTRLGPGTSLNALATDMIRSGWHCEGMRDPEEAYLWLELAVQRDEYWDDIPEQGQNFWKAAQTKWDLWKLRGQ